VQEHSSRELGRSEIAQIAVQVGIDQARNEVPLASVEELGGVADREGTIRVDRRNPLWTFTRRPFVITVSAGSLPRATAISSRLDMSFA
jgi:hypothetical protein